MGGKRGWVDRMGGLRRYMGREGGLRVWQWRVERGECGGVERGGKVG